MDIRKISSSDVRRMFPERSADSHKGTYGYVALVGGSVEYSGAIRLAAMANAAMRSGAGVATIAAPGSICPLIAPQILEATLYPLADANGRLVFRESDFEPLCSRYSCIAFGMGVGNSPETQHAVRYLLQNYNKTLIVDADGLNAMAGLEREIIRNSRVRLVLTPHLREFSRLSGMPLEEIRKDPVTAACYLAEELDAAVLLKGSTTVIAGYAPRGSYMTDDCQNSGAGSDARPHEEKDNREMRVWLNDRGCPGMATAGSGDVLSGILSALCVNADDLVLAAAAGAFINGAAGELAQSHRSAVTMTAGDTAGCIAEVIEKILS